MRPESLHLTIRFLGSVEPAVLERLAAELRSIPFRPIEVRLGALGTFRRGQAVSVVWLGVAARPELLDLAATIEARSRAAGLEAETRPYNPHLTLARARARQGAALPPLPEPPALEGWTAIGFELFRSRPQPGGAVYEVIERFDAVYPPQG